MKLGVFGDLYDTLSVKFDDGDGIPEFVDVDSDGDGLLDAIEGIQDVDEDLRENFVDLDSDNDNIADKIELVLDPDNDGKGCWVDADSDGDAIADSIETNADYDSDGVPNYLDLDSDDDELSDLAETASDLDKNKLQDFLDPHTTIPEVFTPNNNGVNDVLYILGLKNFPNARLTVFDQWGHIVYKSPAGYKNDWNGTLQDGPGYFKGTPLKEGLYFYILDHNTAVGSGFNRPQSKGNIYIKP